MQRKQFNNFAIIINLSIESICWWLLVSCLIVNLFPNNNFMNSLQSHGNYDLKIVIFLNPSKIKVKQITKLSYRFNIFIPQYLIL